MNRARHNIFAIGYMESIGIPRDNWVVLKWDDTSKRSSIQFVAFTGPDRDKYEFIFELHGGANALNKAVDSAYNHWVLNLDKR
jgi:hypothetical protein